MLQSRVKRHFFSVVLILKLNNGILKVLDLIDILLLIFFELILAVSQLPPEVSVLFHQHSHISTFRRWGYLCAQLVDLCPVVSKHLLVFVL